MTTLGDDGADDVTVDVISSSAEDISAEITAEGEESSTAIELVHVSEDFFYMAHIMRLAAALHSLASLAMLIAYYHLKVSTLPGSCFSLFAFCVEPFFSSNSFL